MFAIRKTPDALHQRSSWWRPLTECTRSFPEGIRNCSLISDIYRSFPTSHGDCRSALCPCYVKVTYEGQRWRPLTECTRSFPEGIRNCSLISDIYRSFPTSHGDCRSALYPCYVKVTYEGQRFEHLMSLNIPVLFISPKAFEGFSFKLGQMVTSVRLRAECMCQHCKFKAKVIREVSAVYCSFHISLSNGFWRYFFYFYLFLVETFMTCVNVFYTQRNEISAGSGKTLE